MLSVKYFIVVVFYLLMAPTSLLGRVSNPPAGTAPRQEIEMKLAYWIDPQTNLQDLTVKLQNALDMHIAPKYGPIPLKAPYLIDKMPWINSYFQDYVFLDHYLDTKFDDILNHNSSYRLRYRWIGENKFLRHQLFPFVSTFYPDRCEIQFKADYHQTHHDFLSVEETRFEFRDSARPFSRKNPAPPSPWPFAEYLIYAQVGTFRGYYIWPYHQLLKQLQIENRYKLIIMPKLKVKTTRYRQHISLNHPWGSGPNPTQSYIISLDVSKVLNKKNNDQLLLELEVELERNLSTNLFKLASSEVNHSKGHNQKNIAFSKLAKNLFLADLDYITMFLQNEINQFLQKRPLPIMFKYKRLSRTEDYKMARFIYGPPL